MTAVDTFLGGTSVAATTFLGGDYFLGMIAPDPL
jgi:hypothetical protein